jgi:hypothetical protein
MAQGKRRIGSGDTRVGKRGSESLGDINRRGEGVKKLRRRRLGKEDGRMETKEKVVVI